MTEQTLEAVRDYYGKTLKTSDDLKTSACCPAESPPDYVKSLLANVHETVQQKFYGCGSPLPVAAEGCTVLDLGCGTGRDAFLLSQMVGPGGHVIGVDMTDEQLSVANQYLGWHMDRFGYSEPNIHFVKGYIEDLNSCGIEDNSVDIVISNCVINLSPDKRSVFKEIFRVLKPGGELYFSDIFAGRRIPQVLQQDPIMLGECLGGALYIEDFRRLLRDTGIPDYRVVTSRSLAVEDPELAAKAGMIDFYSMTIRAFNVELEDICENFGHVAYYQGTIAENPHGFVLDDHHEFKTGLPYPVCGNTANMLTETRFSDHFRVDGDFNSHYGAFDCSSDTSPATGSEREIPGLCC